MTSSERVPVVRKWGFWYEGRLVIAGAAIKSDAKCVAATFAETPNYLARVPLPRRLEFEERIRRRVREDIHQSMGPGWRIAIHFEPALRDERALAREVFGTHSHQAVHEEG